MTIQSGTWRADVTCGSEEAVIDRGPCGSTSGAHSHGWSAKIANLSRPEVEVEAARSLGVHVHHLRTSKRMTMHALAKNTGCSQTMICRLEKGTTLPSLYTLVCLAWALDVSPASMLEPIDGLRRWLEEPVATS